MRPCGHTPERPGFECDACLAAAGLVRARKPRKAKPPKVRAALPECPHRGEPTGELAPCGDGKGCKQRVFSCSVHGTCTVQRSALEHCCDGCPDRPSDPWSLVAPLGTSDVERSWEGRARKKPHRYKVTCILPHLNTPEYLEACVALLRLQTLRPYLVVVDTGSPKGVCDRLEAMRAEDLEVHFVRGNGYTHSSEPVCVALDLGFARVNTPLILLTHTDVFLRRKDAVEWLADQCSAECPAVGWEMSPRKNAPNEMWRGMVSHTFTMLHAETMRRLGVTWHMQRGRDLLGIGQNYKADGWPDTETAFNLQLRAAGITPRILGGEPNYQRHLTDWFDHARSLPGLSAYSPGSVMHRRAVAYGARALEEAWDRVGAWRSVLPQRPGQLVPQDRGDGVVSTPGAVLAAERKPRIVIAPLLQGLGVGGVADGVGGRLAQGVVHADHERPAGADVAGQRAGRGLLIADADEQANGDSGDGHERDGPERNAHGVGPRGTGTGTGPGEFATRRGASQGP